MYRQMMICVRDKEITGEVAIIMSHHTMIFENNSVTIVDRVPLGGVALHVVVLRDVVVQVEVAVHPVEAATRDVVVISTNINEILMSAIFTVRILEIISKTRAMIKVGEIILSLTMHKHNKRHRNLLRYY